MREELLEKEKITVSLNATDRIRLYDYLVGKSAIYPTRKGVKKALSRGSIELNGRLAQGFEFLVEGDRVVISPPKSMVTREYFCDVDILFEDEHLALVNKPAGLITSGNFFKTLVNCLPNNLTRSKESDALVDFQPIHRLDRATSGLVIVAKTQNARWLLGEMMENRMFTKFYRAFVHGSLNGNAALTFPLDDKDCVTHIWALENFGHQKFGAITELKLSPITGRTHQLRRHLAGIGCPIVGDKSYVAERKTVMDKGLFLQAYALKFSHPITNALIDVSLDAPRKFISFKTRFK